MSLRDGWLLGTVTATSPLRVRFDGDTDEIPSTPITLVAGLGVGDRVWCQLHSLQLVVHGRVGGTGSASSATRYAHLSPSGYTSTGASLVETFGDGSKRVTHSIEITRAGSTLALSDVNVWYGPTGAVIPTEARTSGVTLGRYGLGSWEDSTEVNPIAIDINPADGTLRFKPVTIPHTWDIGSLMWTQRVILVPAP